MMRDNIETDEAGWLKIKAVKPGRGKAIMMPKDPRTGRPLGDHGTALQAINFALDVERNHDANTFLRAWREGDLNEWPEFYEWLATDDRKSHGAA